MASNQNPQGTPMASPSKQGQGTAGGQTNPSTSITNRAQEEQDRQRALTAPRTSGVASSPFGIMRRFMDEMDRMFTGWPGGSWAGATDLWNPQVEVFRRGNELVVRADLPGIPQDAIKVRVEDRSLVISGERRHDEEKQERGWYHSERSYGSFQRVLPLPDGADIDALQARFDNGVLEVTTPFREPGPRGREVAIGGTTPRGNETRGSKN
jgi:HSP20 family protein